MADFGAALLAVIGFVLSVVGGWCMVEARRREGYVERRMEELDRYERTRQRQDAGLALLRYDARRQQSGEEE